MRSNEIRSKFLKYFEKNGHKILPGSSLIPKDPTVLLTLAGMLQFKPVFLGLEKPFVVRAATVQKCVRTNDIENVGHTARHHTFFEMLGNFSFGDYFKKEAIAFAWELITKEFNIDPKRLRIAVFEHDMESENIWKKGIGISGDQVIRLGEDNNFWAAGPTGPCGPCSEIYYDMGDDSGCGSPGCAPGCDCDRFLEIWNLVFMEFNRDEAGKLSPLPKKNIDTGMGLERIASVLQNVPSNFDTDLFVPIMDSVKQLAGINEKDHNTSLRIIADHARTAAFLVSDGLYPGNEGRNYILRRVIRRAVLHGRKLGIKDAFMEKLVAVVADIMGGFYTDIAANKGNISKIIGAEEDGFAKTLEQGVELLEGLLSKASSGVVKGDDIFRLYDTYGFPAELTKEIAQERGFSLDLEGFEKAMAGQKNRSKEASSKKYSLGTVPQIKGYPPTVFTGYDHLEIEAKVLGVTEGFIILDRSPFYVESGGQDSDKGWLEIEKNLFEVSRLVKTAEGVILHKTDSDMVPAAGETVRAVVNKEIRGMLARHHTSTHLLHSALRSVLGAHVKQTGSYVGSDKFRFDFSHFEAVKGDDLEKIEKAVNKNIRDSVPVETIVTSIDEARRMGAMALFDAKYGEKVRMVKIGDVSKELCGGTHVKDTSEIGQFKIIKDSAIAQGMRRIEAVAGACAEGFLKVQKAEEEKAGRLQEEKEKGKEEEKRQEKEALAGVDALAASITLINGVNVIYKEYKGFKPAALKKVFDPVSTKAGSCVLVMVSVLEDRASIIVGITPDLVKKGLSAGNIIRELAAVIGGKGGGRPELAEAGGKELGNIGKLKDKLAEIIGL